MSGSATTVEQAAKTLRALLSEVESGRMTSSQGAVRALQGAAAALEAAAAEDGRL